jgi:hypothetical protein
MNTKVLYKAVRQTTDSIITGEIPEEIGIDPEDCVQWIGEEYNWQFNPAELKLVTLKENENEST